MPSLMQLPAVVRIRRWGALRLLQRLHRLTHRLSVELASIEERRRILVVAPHMDDEVIGPGGTLIRHREVGSSIVVAFCARGSDLAVNAAREGEARAVAAEMGFEALHFLGYTDGKLSQSEEAMADDLSRLIEEVRPDQIFCPFPPDHHRDHAAASVAVARAIRATSWTGDVWCYEVWSPLWPNVAVDISGLVEHKKKLIGMHESQVAGLDYVEGILGLNRYRGLRVYVPAAEAFFAVPARDFLETAELMNQL